MHIFFARIVAFIFFMQHGVASQSNKRPAISLVWSNLTVSRNEKTLVSLGAGFIESGRLLAILGAKLEMMNANVHLLLLIYDPPL